MVIETTQVKQPRREPGWCYGHTNYAGRLVYTIITGRGQCLRCGKLLARWYPEAAAAEGAADGDPVPLDQLIRRESHDASEKKLTPEVSAKLQPAEA